MNTKQTHTATTYHHSRPAWRRWMNTGLLGVSLLGSLPSLAQAVSCGDTLGPGGTVVLDRTLSCNPLIDPTALTIVGPVTVDLNNHEVGCLGFSIGTRDKGLVVLGKKAKVKNGTILGCHTGVELGGQGQHTLTNLTVEDSLESGIRVDSDKNTLTKTTVSGSRDNGFLVREDTNTLTGNTAMQNGRPGFLILGNRNKLTGNTATSNDLDGFAIAGSSNKLTTNTATNNTVHGFDIGGSNNTLTNNDAHDNIDEFSTGFVVSGVNQTLQNNTASDNNNEGFLIFADDTTLRNNRATDNGEEGFAIFGDRNLVQQNRAQDNRQGGIRVSGVDNQIFTNTALGHFLDLEDANVNCATNTWEDNTFDSANQGCIQ